MPSPTLDGQNVAVNQSSQFPTITLTTVNANDVIVVNITTKSSGTPVTVSSISGGSLAFTARG